MKFSIILKQPQTKGIMGIQDHSDYLIEDQPARGSKSKSRHGSRIYIKPQMDIKEIFAALADHMILFYSVEPESLTMEVCRE